MSEKIWRLTTDVVFIVENTDGENLVYIASPEKKQYEVAVSKLAKEEYSRQTIENTDFDIKISTEDDRFYPDIYIKTDQIPELGWAKISNFNYSSFWNVISQCNLNKGNLSGKFKIIFTESDPRVVSLVSPDMSEYKDTVEEMKRRLRCEIGKKTKSLKPGHRYDLLKETRYYLCEVVSRKFNKCNSIFIDDDEAAKSVKAYIYTNKISDTDTTISDVLNNRKFGSGSYDLKIAIDENSVWIDSGEILKDDFTGNIKDYWETIVEKTIESNIVRAWSSCNYVIYNLDNILGILSCQSEKDMSYDISDSFRNKLTDIICNNINFYFLYNWGLKPYDKDLEICDKKDIYGNVKSLSKLFYNSIDDENILKNIYYEGLFNKLRIDINNISRSIIINFYEPDLSNSLDNFMKYRFYWKNKKFMYSKPILDFTLNKIVDPSGNIENIFGTSELSNTIRELYEHALSNYGEGIEDFSIRNTKGKGIVVLCKITLNDIIKFKKGVSRVSETLKSEIILNKFDSITIQCNKSDTI